MSDKFQSTPTDELLRAKDTRIADLEAQLTKRTIDLRRALADADKMVLLKLEHTRCQLFLDGITEALLPTFELIANDMGRFGAHRDAPLAPIINEFFLKAYGSQTEKQPATSDAPKDEGDGRELFRFTRSAKLTTDAGTAVMVGTTDDGAAFTIEATTTGSTGSTGKSHTQKIAVRASTLYSIIALVTTLTNRSIVATPGKLPAGSMQ